MAKSMKEFSYSLELRDVVNRIIRDQVNKLRPRYRYATVVLIDRVNRKCTIIYNGETNEVIVNMGSVQPKDIGQTVRIEGIGTDKYIADVMGDSHLYGLTGGEPLPSSSTYMHTQSVAAATWVITHNLNKYPTVTLVVGGDHVYADVAYASLNQVSVSFPTARTGTAHLV